MHCASTPTLPQRLRQADRRRSRRPPAPTACPRPSRWRPLCPPPLFATLPQARRQLHLLRCYLTTFGQERVSLHDFQAAVDAAYDACGFSRQLAPAESVQLALRAGFRPAAAGALARGLQERAAAAAAVTAADSQQLEEQQQAQPPDKRQQQAQLLQLPLRLPKVAIAAWEFNYVMWWFDRCAFAAAGCCPRLSIRSLCGQIPCATASSTHQWPAPHPPAPTISLHTCLPACLSCMQSPGDTAAGAPGVGAAGATADLRVRHVAALSRSPALQAAQGQCLAVSPVAAGRQHQNWVADGVLQAVVPAITNWDA